MSLIEQKRRISKIIEIYDNQGINRTGTNVDRKNAQWLADEIKKLGLNPIMDGFIINRLDIKDAYLKIGERHIKGIPIFRYYGYRAVYKGKWHLDGSSYSGDGVPDGGFEEDFLPVVRFFRIIQGSV